ncbi:MAG: PAS domain S-box-containing protein [Flavobacteriales bacterium]|jgi:PAS domain S-box-containing protein
MLIKQLKELFSKFSESMKEQANIAPELLLMMKEFDDNLTHVDVQINLAQQISRTGTWEWHVKKNEIFWTKELYLILGLNPETHNLTFEDYVSHIHIDDQAIFHAIIQKSIEEQASFEVTHRVINEKKQELVLSCKGKAIYKNGALDFMFGTATDITQEDFAQRKLMESEKHFKLLTEHSQELICLLDSSGNYKYASPSSYKLTGYFPDELIGKSQYDFFHIEDQNHIRKEIDNLVKKGETASVFYRFKKKNGNYIWLHTLFQAITSDEKEIITIHTSSRDYTEQHHDQLRIKEEEKKFKDLLESAPDAMVFVNKEGEIVLVNAQAEKLFGYAKKEMLGQQVGILIPHRYSKYHHSYAHQPKPLKMGEGRELFGVRKDGTEFPVEISLSPIETNDGLYVSSAIRDITERVAIQNELKQATIKAEENIRLKQDFLANMSHEIRTPMNAILGFTKFLLKTKLTDEQLNYTTTIDNSVEDLLLIINDILDFSRLEAGKVSLEKIPFNLKHKICQVAQLNKMKSEEKGLIFEFNWGKNLPELMIGDPLRLGQMITNLVSNAIKFTFKGSVSLNVNLLQLKKDICQIQFQVIDTGIGVAEKNKKIIFESFRQAQGNTTREYGGTGLGLSIVKNLVELHEGNIDFTSLEKQGSTFEITLWYSIAQHMELEEEVLPVERKDVEGIKTLLAEDNRANQMITKKICRDWGIVLEIVSTGKEAIERLDETFDLVLMDIQMPIMDGEEATKIIRSEGRQYSDVPIIALTAHAMKEEHDRFISLGMNACLFKPFKELELIHIIKQYSDRNK